MLAKARLVERGKVGGRQEAGCEGRRLQEAARALF